MSAYLIGGCVGAAATALFVGITTFGVGLIADLASDAADAVRRTRRKARQSFAEAVRKWCRVNKWRQGTRLDEVRVYGRPEDGRPCIDHIQNIKN